MCWCRKLVHDKETQSDIHQHLQVEDCRLHDKSVPRDIVDMICGTTLPHNKYLYVPLPRRHQYLLCTALDCCKQETLSKEPLTIACHSISSVPRVASTCEGPKCVGAGSACMTRRLSQTFIDVCRRGLHQVTGDTLRH